MLKQYKEHLKRMLDGYVEIARSEKRAEEWKRAIKSLDLNIAHRHQKEE